MGKTRKQKAGKYVQRGSYGCTYRPALYCEGDSERQPNSISKLMLSEQAEKEYKKQEIFQEIDPDRKFFVTASRICKPDLTKLDPLENNTGSCELVFKATNNAKTRERYKNRKFNLSTAKIIEYPDAGQDLTRVSLKISQYYEYFKGFANLFQGLAKLHEAGHYHLDIKPDNIVLKEMDGIFSMRFIDFGFSCNAATFHQTLTNKRLEELYKYWPLDIQFPRFTYDEEPFENNYVFEEIQDDHKKILEALYQVTKQKVNPKTRVPESYIEYVVAIPYDIIANISTIPYEDYIHGYDKDLGLYKKYKKMLTRNDDTNALKALLPTIDIYSLGVTMSLLFTVYVGIMQEDDFKIKIVKPTPFNSELVKKNTLDSFLKDVASPFIELIKKMMDMDFTLRPTAGQAYEEYIKILAAMEPYFNIQEGGKQKVTRKQKKYKTK
jgi:serine/threonine protein kinase